jgi:copper(I)-binding protein
MSFKPVSRGAILLAVTSFLMITPALAHDGLKIADPYARAASPNAKAGAAFMVIENHTEAEDRLLSASSDVAVRVELHTHIDDGNGTMQMRQVEEGFVIPAGGAHVLGRGGDHVMFMGLTRSLMDGDTVSVTFTFEKAGDIVVDIPVDLNR